jgi:peptidyl-prolyl cis-trans isomerase D
VKAGGNFADLAKKNSDDASSAKNGGSLGWIQRGRFGSADEDKVVFALPKGGTSDAIATGSGFDIVHVDDKQDAHVKSLDEVRPEIEPILKQQRAAQKAQDVANNLLTKARSDGLEKAAANGYSVVTTDFVGRSDSLPGVGSAPQLMDAVFSATDKAPPDQATVPQGFAIYQVTAIQPPSTPTFDQIRSRVETEFKSEQARTLLAQKTQELADRAKADHDLKKAAKELGATMKTSDLVLPNGQVPDIGSMAGPAAVAFTLKQGDISGPIESVSSGAVLSIVEKQDPSDQDFGTKRDEIRSGILEQKQSELFGLFVENARAQMEKTGKIKINQEELKGLTRPPNGEGDEGGE